MLLTACLRVCPAWASLKMRSGYSTSSIERSRPREPDLSAVTWLVASLARGDEEQALEWLKKAAEKAASTRDYILTFRVKTQCP